LKMQEKIDRALEILGIRNFIFGIHDAAFPSLPEEDLGRGSPYSEGAADFLRFVRSLGFNGVQLGPQGITTSANSSPYDGSLFSRSPLSLAPLTLTRSDCQLFAPEKLARITAHVHSDRTRVDDLFSRLAIGDLTAEICAQFRREIREGKSASCTALGDSFAIFRRQNAVWLERDALYQVLSLHYNGKSWKQWEGRKEARLDRHLFGSPEGEGCKELVRLRLAALHQQYSEAIDDYCFIQFLLAVQHRKLRESCQRLGLKLFGDCQVGFSDRDTWYAQSFLLQEYVMGAPPSRTNPDGQPWNYAVLDPRYYTVAGSEGSREPGPAVLFLQQRIKKMVEDFDGLRLDHPHGLICPWVYKAAQVDPFSAVQNGARLFASPLVTDHPALIQFAIVRQDQLNKNKQRYEDNWVAALDPEQVNRYAQLLEVVIRTVREKWADGGEVACEILSTQPYPVQRVMELYGLGRFRVTQKADLTNEHDVYRSENAQSADWLMLGNHDTAPIWQVADKWVDEGFSRRQAEYLAMRLRIPETERTDWIDRLSVDTGALVQAKFADLFVGSAQNIMVFFADLLGNKETYNKPGTINSENWMMRVSPDYETLYKEKLATSQALNIPGALAMALKARGRSTSIEDCQLIRELENYY
jgi:4-alpha-glucanotransferase